MKKYLTECATLEESFDFCIEKVNEVSPQNLKVSPNLTYLDLLGVMGAVRDKIIEAGIWKSK